MPHHHKIKTYIENGYYHVYNRGVDKRIIFQNDQDYRIFLHLLKYYLSPIDPNSKHPLENLPHYSLIRPRPLANLYQQVDLLAYCLMPNHFHLLIKQLPKDGMSKLMRRLLTTYAMYFNKKNDRVGYLFQGVYKAVLIDTDAYLLHLSRYIHLNPSKLTRTNLVSYPYSSYAYYIGTKKAKWLKPDFILNYFKSVTNFPLLSTKYTSYQQFVESHPEDPRKAVGLLALD